MFGVSAFAILWIVAAFCISVTDLNAQTSSRPSSKVQVAPLASDVVVKNQFIEAIVGANDGLVTVLPLGPDPGPTGPCSNGGRLGLDAQLSFYKHSYFTCKIGTLYYTNNDLITNVAPNAHSNLNSYGVTSYISDVTGNNIDTVRTIWAANKQSGVQITQDIFCIPFTKSGQVVYSWKFTNTTGVAVPVTCQYLNDIDIGDPCDHRASNAPDGPKVLTQYQYDSNWTQFPNTTINAMPPFYIAFNISLPAAPSFNPGISAMGYLTAGLPLNVITPISYTNGDWGFMGSSPTGSIFGPPAGAPAYNSGFGIGSDNAILMVFAPISVGPGKTVEVGRTSYGTGEYERCIGNLFSIVFYPHHLVWTKDKPTPPGSYSPNPIHIQKFVVDPGPPQNVNPSGNTRITLNVSKDLTLSDSLCKTFYGKSQTNPPTSSPGVYINPGGVAYFDWWACASPAEFCTGAVQDTLTFTAQCSFCPPAFNDQIGNLGSDECQLTLQVDCAELDHDPPTYSDTLADCHSVSINVSDSRTTDRGLASITWVPTPKPPSKFVTDPSKFTITVTPPIAACFTDKVNHLVTITKTNPADSLMIGSFDFTFTDCLGNVSKHTVVIDSCTLVSHPDTLPPVYTQISKSGSYDGSACNTRTYSFGVFDGRKYDKGMDSIIVISGSDTNMKFTQTTFPKCIPADTAFFTVSVKDSMFDGSLCVRAFDCAKQANYADTCFRYCTIPDKLAPQVVITKNTTRASSWHVCVYEGRPWDRHIDEVFIVGGVNVALGNVNDTLRANTSGRDTVCFDLTGDSTQTSSFCIEANDLAGNRTASGAYCSNQTIGHDTLCPNIVITPPLNTNPTSITVNVDDTHTNPNGTTYVWDSGIDQVTFTNNHGMLVPGTLSGNGAKTLPPFTVSVIDTLNVDTAACVTINAKDKAGNVCSETFCYPYSEDIIPPVITLRYNPADSSQILGVVTDTTIYDRGVSSVSLLPANDVNFSFAGINAGCVRLQPLAVPNVITRNPRQSSIATCQAIDCGGDVHKSPVTGNIGTVGFEIWVQDFWMKPGFQPDQGSVFEIPVYFAKNDTFKVLRKGIKKFTMTFTISGDVNSIVFDGASMTGTEMAKANWNAPTWSIAGSTVTVTGTMGAGTPLASVPLDTAVVGTTNPVDSLVLFNFHSVEDVKTRQVQLINAKLVLNDGADTIFTGTKNGTAVSTARMPSPYGILGGSTIVITGSCSPKISSDNAKPTSVSLDQNHPNPFSKRTTFGYTVVSEGPVRFAIYDMLGNEVAHVVDEVQKQGAYTLTYDGTKLPAGTYIARLQTGGQVRSCSISVAK
jgi:hypothetical protein